MVTQKITGTEVTKFDDDFSKLEKASDIYIDLQVDQTVFVSNGTNPFGNFKKQVFYFKSGK